MTRGPDLKEVVGFWRKKLDERMKDEDRSRLPRNTLKDLVSWHHPTVAAVARDLPLGWIGGEVWRMIDTRQIPLSMGRVIGAFVRQYGLPDARSHDLAVVARNGRYTAHEFGGALSDCAREILEAQEWAKESNEETFAQMVERLVEEHLGRTQALHDELAILERRVEVFEALATTPFRASEAQAGLLERDRKMARARKNLDWNGQIALSFDPDRVSAWRAATPPTESEVCSMCGEFCAIRTVERALRPKTPASS